LPRWCRDLDGLLDGRCRSNIRNENRVLLLLRDPLRAGQPLEPLIEHTLAIKPERHYLVQGSAAGSGGLLALSQVGG
jgi:hypothetical protein